MYFLLKHILFLLICKFCWDVQFILAIQQKKKKIPPLKQNCLTKMWHIFHEYKKNFVCNMKNSKALKFMLNLKRMLIVKTRHWYVYTFLPKFWVLYKQCMKMMREWMYLIHELILVPNLTPEQFILWFICKPTIFGHY